MQQWERLDARDSPGCLRVGAFVRHRAPQGRGGPRVRGAVGAAGAGREPPRRLGLPGRPERSLRHLVVLPGTAVASPLAPPSLGPAHPRSVPKP